MTLFVLDECAVTLGSSLKAFHGSDTQLGTMAERRRRMETRGKTIFSQNLNEYMRDTFFSKAELVESNFSYQATEMGFYCCIDNQRFHTAHTYVTKYTLSILKTSMVIELCLLGCHFNRSWQ